MSHSLLDSPEPLVRAVAVKRGKLTPAQHERALTDEDADVRLAAVKRGQLSPKQHERALSDKVSFVRYAAINLGNLTQEQLERTLRTLLIERFFNEQALKNEHRQAAGAIEIVELQTKQPKPHRQSVFLRAGRFLFGLGVTFIGVIGFRSNPGR